VSVDTEHVRELSVFLPAHDEAENLGRTVTSAVAALDQLGLQDLEVVVVDDGSTDGTGDWFSFPTSTEPPNWRFRSRKPSSRG